jgi:hypothetical protein
MRLGQGLANLQHIARVQMRMRIAGRVHVTVSAVEYRRHIETIDVARRLEIPRSTGLNG